MDTISTLIAALLSCKQGCEIGIKRYTKIVLKYQNIVGFYKYTKMFRFHILNLKFLHFIRNKLCLQNYIEFFFLFFAVSCCYNEMNICAVVINIIFSFCKLC